jgi:hypothetical protein
MRSRPLLNYKRDHKTLFLENTRLREEAARSLGLHQYRFYKTPKFITDEGEKLTIEPERSVIVPHYEVMTGVIPLLKNAIAGFSVVENSESGFRYPTAALAGQNAPFIKRMRSEYFHKTDEDRSICRPVNLSYGIKSRGKADNRLEYEVWVPDSQMGLTHLPLMIEKYGEDLPQSIRDFILQPSCVHGWMGVKRAAFDALYQCTDTHLVMCLSLSLDAYNIGARPDLAFSPQVESSIALSQAEFEWEVLGYFAPIGVELNQDVIWSSIHQALEAVSQPLHDSLNSSIIPSNESKTERILSVVAGHGVTSNEIAQLNLQPQEFLQTSSESRLKRHDSNRTVNLLGRLNRLFYQPEHILPSLQTLHDVMISSS